MKRAASAEAFDKIRRSGVLGKRQWECYVYFFNAGPMAQYRLLLMSPRTTWAESIRKRISELVVMGLMEVVGETINPHTKMKVNVFDVTDHVPEKTYAQTISDWADAITEMKKTHCPHCGRKWDGQRELRI